MLAVEKTGGALTGMIPAGIYLLITLALALGIVKLAKKKTLVKDLYSIEMLARSNVLCLDKTGTITDGTMEVSSILEFEMLPKTSVEQIVSNVLFSQRTGNATSTALVNRFGKRLDWQVKRNVEFSSKRKITATSFEGKGTFIIGAPEFTHCEITDKMQKEIFALSKEGKRVLMLAHNKKMIKEDDEIPTGNKPLCLIAIEDHIRSDAKETIEWFKNNEVEIKIISGDNPITVANIAKRVGVDNADKCVSLEGMSLVEVSKIADKFTVFGRVSPEQKHTLVKALKTKGFVVAMTGDGVNDTLALKESDCSIAMADGSAVARDLSKLVLLDSKFSSLPQVVREGRQVINNVQQSASLYLMKTIFTILLSVVTLVTFTEYPFAPSQLILLEFFVIGMPSTILALQPNTQLIKGDFIPMTLKRALPSGLLLFINVFMVLIIDDIVFLNALEIQSLATLVLIFTGLVNLLFLCLPFTKLKATTLGLSAGGILFALLFLGSKFGVSVFTWTMFLILVPIVAFAVLANFVAPKIALLWDKFKVKLGIKDLTEILAAKIKIQNEKDEAKRLAKEKKKQQKAEKVAEGEDKVVEVKKDKNEETLKDQAETVAVEKPKKTQTTSKKTSTKTKTDEKKKEDNVDLKIATANKKIEKEIAETSKKTKAVKKTDVEANDVKAEKPKDEKLEVATSKQAAKKSSSKSTSAKTTKTQK